MFPFRYLVSMLIGGAISAAIFNDSARENLFKLAKLAENEINRMVEGDKKDEA